MAPEKHDLAATRERLEFLLEKDGGTPGSPSTGSTRQAFLAGAAFSGLIAGSIFLTNFIDTKLHESEITPSLKAVPILAGATNGRLGAREASIKSISSVSMSDNGGEARRNRISATTDVFPVTTRISPEVRINGTETDIRTRTPRPVSAFTPPENTQVKQALVPVAGLSTSRSVITGVADPQTMTASYYWTFTLKNKTNSSKEAQMNIALPNGAVVSRATLWINGRAEEAVFNTTSQVQNAYDWIVTRNRDPLLITQTEDGNINLKASPVMPKKEMKIRIGITTPMQMTADGQSQMELPHIIDANLDFHCQQNVHITSEAPLVSNDTRMNSPTQKHGFLLRGNVNAGDLQKLQVTAQRDQNLTKFATRATHSNPPSYIIAELQKDNQGLSTLSLSKSVAKPDCPILKDEHAAFRMSYLWVKKEIARLASANDRIQAEQLATVYRVVSPVSGAVVLERQTDYDYNGLDRNMYKSLAYEPSQVDDSFANASGYASFQTQGPASEFQRAVPAPRPSAAPSATPSPAPMAFDKVGGNVMASDARLSAQPIYTRRRAEHNSEQAGKRDFSANKIALMPVETKATEKAAFAQKKVATSLIPQDPSADLELPKLSPAGAQSESNFSPSPALPLKSNTTVRGSDQAVRLTGPAGSKLVSMARDANMLFLSNPITTAALLSLLGLTFAGAFILYAMAALRLNSRQPGAIKLASCGAVWLVVAAFAPLFSQVFTIMLATGLTIKAVMKAFKPLSR